MSDISESARVAIIVADFANVDGANKLNLIGAGVSITGIDPQNGQTAPLYAVVTSHVPPKFIGQQYALELALYGEDGQVVTPPGPIEGPPVRIAQVVMVQAPAVPQGSYVPPESVWSGTQIIIGFQNGLPLAAGKAYEWRLSIDSNVVAAASLAVAGPPPIMIG